MVLECKQWSAQVKLKNFPQISILQVLSSEWRSLIHDFASANPEWRRPLNHRILTYWDIHYRRQIPRLTDYPGYRLAQKLELWDNKTAPKLTRAGNAPDANFWTTEYTDFTEGRWIAPLYFPCLRHFFRGCPFQFFSFCSLLHSVSSVRTLLSTHFNLRRVDELRSSRLWCA